MIIKTEKYYTLENIIKKVQLTSIKLKPNFEIITSINNGKALQNFPLIIIIGEEHTANKNSESYYLKDLEKIAKIANIFEIKDIFLEGLAKGEEKNISNTILNGEIELIKFLGKDKKYNISGVEILEIQIKILELGFIVYYSNYLKLINESFANLIKNNENFKIEIINILNKIYTYVLNGKNSDINTQLNVSSSLYLSMQETKINYIEIYKKIELFYGNLLIHINSLKIFPKNLNEFNFEANKITNNSGMNPILDKKKIEQLHFKYISSVRDEIFAKNILDTIKENDISKSIFF